ncbi:MAG: hypothetical protein KKB91_00165 [Proteobacteria bacterium]|nr:hypothetical protein [Desulfocapsa sp.]MBU3946560.1 hypothetical protein [Pseudomonadota bacterium]MCG2742836.1 hypothetical protein [Desulfobacteraceae bacterium]MBU3982219.1 hypothetical protein [Pseudomonadota bacterium]MBU4029371.1 hypothetical protein [Pseudomonadota bacterium]
MAKCTVCDSRKGKRKCKSTGTFICSLCCGETREQEKCEGCSFISPVLASRNYRSVPYFSTEEMAKSPELEGIAENIEKLLCMVWAADSKNFNDGTAARLVERMIDKYHFKDDKQPMAELAIASGDQLLSQAVSQELEHVPTEKLVKVLAAVYRAIQRRTIGGSSYLEFVSHFTQIYPK